MVHVDWGNIKNWLFCAALIDIDPRMLDRKGGQALLKALAQ